MFFKIKYILVYAMLNVSVVSVISAKMYTNILNKMDNEIDYSVKCIKNIARKYFPCGTLMSLVNSNIRVDELIRVITNSSCNSLVIRSFERKKWLISTDAYIVTTTDKFEFSLGILQLRNDVLWNPRAKFIIEIQQLKMEEISEVFKIFNYLKIYNVILLRIEDVEIVIYTYYPFSNGACSNRIQDAVKLGNCEDIDNISNIFENKLPDTIDNCTFRVIACEDIPNFIFKTSNFTVYGEHVLGMEQYLLSIIAENERVQFQFILKPSEYKYSLVFQNGTVTGLFKYLENDIADIAGGGFVLTKNRIEMFDFIWGINYIGYYIFTPSTTDIIWEDVYKEFKFYTWTLIFTIYCLIVIIFVVKRKTMSKTFQNRMYLALRLWGYLCSNPSSKLSKEKNIRIILIWWIWFTFFIASFYNTAMFSLITKRDHTKRQMNTENLEELPYKPCIADTSRNFFHFVYNITINNDKSDQSCQYIGTALDFVVTRNDLFTIETEYAYALNEYKYIDQEGRSKLDSVQFLSPNAINLYFSRGFPFRDKFNKYAKRMSETGLFKRQLNKILMHGRIIRHPRKKSFEKLNLLDLIIHYYILLSSFAISLILFIFEIISHRKTARS